MFATTKYILERFLVILLVLSPFWAWFTYMLGFAFYNFLFMYLLLTAIIQWMSQKIRIPNYFYFLLFFAIYVFLSDVFIVQKQFNYFHYFTRAPYICTCLAVLVIANMSVTDKDIKRIIFIFKLLIPIAFIVVLYQQLVDGTFLLPKESSYIESMENAEEYEIRLASIFGYLSPVCGGFYLIPLVALILTIYLKNKTNKSIAYILYFIGFILAFLLKSRWILVNMIIVFLLFFHYRALTVKNFLFRGGIIFILSFFILQGVQYLGVPVRQIWEERVLETDKKGISQKSAGTRILAVQAFVKLFPKHPIFGVGEYKYGVGGYGKNNPDLERFLRNRSSQMHVGILNLFYSYGLLGGLLFFIACVLIIKRFYRTAKLSNQWAPFYGILGMIIANLTLVFFSFYTVGLLLCFVLENYYRNQLVIKEENT